LAPPVAPRPARVAPQPVAAPADRPVAKPAEPSTAPPASTGSVRPSVRGQVRLEQSLRRILDRPVLITLTSNRSTMISFRKRGRAIFIRVHAMFQEASDDVIEAMAAFVSLKEMPKAQAKLLDDWIERYRGGLTEARVQAMKLFPVGEAHDLTESFARLNAEYFDGRIDALITWSRSARKLRRSTIRMGTYSHDLRLIRIHPALDQEFVPPYFVDFVVFHEMLHQVHNTTDGGCERRAVHTPAFRHDEKRFRFYKEARAWERQHLSRLLRY
jgi:hypothetical protein